VRRPPFPLRHGYAVMAGRAEKTEARSPVRRRNNDLADREIR